MARRKHAAHGAKHREAGKNCIRCGEDLNISGTTKFPYDENRTMHMRDDEPVAVTAEAREHDNKDGVDYFEGGLYCPGCDSSIENRDYLNEESDTLTDRGYM